MESPLKPRTPLRIVSGATIAPRRRGSSTPRRKNAPQPPKEDHRYDVHISSPRSAVIAEAGYRQRFTAETLAAIRAFLAEARLPEAFMVSSTTIYIDKLPSGRKALVRNFLTDLLSVPGSSAPV
jgi:hypothetical protein